MKFKAPKIASTARPGQFVIIRVDERGERIPMGLAGWDEKEGTVDIVFYVLGTSTAKLSTLKEGESLPTSPAPWERRQRSRTSAESSAPAAALGWGPHCRS